MYIFNYEDALRMNDVDVFYQACREEALAHIRHLTEDFSHFNDLFFTVIHVLTKPGQEENEAISACW